MRSRPGSKSRDDGARLRRVLRRLYYATIPARALFDSEYANGDDASAKRELREMDAAAKQARAIIDVAKEDA